MTKTPNLNLNVPDYQDERWDVPVNENWNLIDTAVEAKQDKATAVNYDNISNCITEIPQDIKLELNNGALTLKAGSKAYMPDGTQYTITSDASGTNANNGTCLVTSRGFGLVIMKKELCFSGNTQPTFTGNVALWLDTSNSKLKYTTDGGSTWLSGYCLPYCQVTVSNGAISSIDQVFNGFGYIGSTVFALPGVKGLIPNGRNTDGSLKNTEFTIPTVKTITRYINGGEFVWAIQQDGEIVTGYNYFTSSETQPTSGFHLWYKPSENIIYRINKGSLSGKILACFGGSEYRNSVSPYRVERITPKTAFHAVDYNDFAPVKAQVDTNTTALTTKANVGLDNLNADGQMIIDSQNGTISNCILEIPQNIKLTLENNVLTLKAGSVVVLANGNTYTTQTITSDITRTIQQYNKTLTVFLRENSVDYMDIRYCYSGSSAPTISTQWALWYNTDEKVLYYTSDTGQTWVANNSYPLCVLKTDTSYNCSFAKDSNGNDMIFNGAGFIGHHAFVYPGVKALVCKGYKADGTLNNLLFNNQSLQILELRNPSYGPKWYYPIQLNAGGSIGRFAYRHIKTKDELLQQSALIQYVESDNVCYLWNNSSYGTQNWCPFVDYTYDGTTVTDFTIRQPVRLATTEMLDSLGDTKLDKVTGTTSVMQSYVKNPDGTQSMANIVQNSASAGSLVIRTSTGTIKTATPAADDDAATKLYVDNGLATKVNNDKFQTAKSVPSTFTDGVWLAVFEGGQQ